MFILFSFIVMRVTGVIELNSVLSRAELPGSIKGMFIFMLSAMIYVWTNGMLYAEPETLLEYALMLIKELGIGACIAFGMELSLAVVRFGGTLIDFMMGLNMAQMYDPSSNQQVTPNANLLGIFVSLIFFTSNAHLRYIQIIFDSIKLIPFGQVQINAGIAAYMIKLFNSCIIMGLQLAFPILAIELLAEISLGILMRVIPQLNIFSVNFQLKIIVGMVMLLVLFSPLADMLTRLISELFEHLDEIMLILAG